MTLPGTYVRCMSGHYYCSVRGDEHCPTCQAIASSQRVIASCQEAERTWIDLCDKHRADSREMAKQMRERASFGNTSASLKRLLESWAEVLEGSPSTGWASMNREDSRNESESSQ